jgi:peroxiredoxin
MLKREFLTVLILACVLLVVNGCKDNPASTQAAKPAPEPASEPATAQPAIPPVAKTLDFTLSDHDGKQVKLSDYSGKIVVLEWFNYDCPFVKPHYKAGTFANLANKYAENGVIWLTVNSTHYANTQTNKEWAQKHNVAHPILDDRTGKVGRLFGATNTPHMFIIDADGKIAYKGAIDNAPLGKVKGEYVNYVDKALAQLTAGKTVSLAKTKPYGCSVKYAN